MKTSAELKRFVELLKQRQLNVATAESCTGGMLAQQLTSLAGSSAYFDRGWVTYSNASKTDLLAVPAELITEQGAVSEAVAKAMALGALVRSQADLAIAITGIAGPGGGSADKPVGTVCFAWAVRQRQCLTRRVQFSGDRKHIRELACEIALKGSCEILHFV